MAMQRVKSRLQAMTPVMPAAHVRGPSLGPEQVVRRCVLDLWAAEPLGAGAQRP